MWITIDGCKWLSHTIKKHTIIWWFAELQWWICLHCLHLLVFFHFQNNIFNKMCTACWSGIFNQDWTSKRITEESPNSTPKKLSAGCLLAKHKFSMVISPIVVGKTPRKITESTRKSSHDGWWGFTNLAGLDGQYDLMDDPMDVVGHIPWISMEQMSFLKSIKHHEASWSHRPSPSPTLWPDCRKLLRRFGVSEGSYAWPDRKHVPWWWWPVIEKYAW